MKQVRIAELKAGLSGFLRRVQRGESIAVLDRDTPIAHIVPIGGRMKLRVTKPAAGVGKPGEVALGPPVSLDFDIVDLLLEERQGHR